MTSPTPPARFPTVWTMGALTGTAVVAAVLAQPLVALLTRQDPQVVPSVQAMALVAWLISLVGLLPVILLGPLGVMQTVWGYFLGSAIRVVLGLAGWYLVSTSQHLPADMTGLALMTVYLPLLFVEVGFVARYLWAKDAALVAAARASGEAQGAVATHPADSKVLA